ASPDCTVNEYGCGVVQPEFSVTVIVKLNAPVAVGVPASVPFDASVSPAGNVPLVTAAVNVSAEPRSESDDEYGVLRIGSGRTVGTTIVFGQTRSEYAREPVADSVSVAVTVK